MRQFLFLTKSLRKKNRLDMTLMTSPDEGSSSPLASGQGSLLQSSSESSNASGSQASGAAAAPSFKQNT